jgi:molybdenum cofactor biosynthesis protein MoaC
MKKLSHQDKKGKAKMVDVSDKNETLRTASAKAEVVVSERIIKLIKGNTIAKGDVFAVAKIAGIMAAKKTSELIPLCHNIFISSIDIKFDFDEKKNIISIRSEIKTQAKTGVEMEALTVVTVAALTIYDMCKAVDKSIVITNIELLSKSGGKSGNYRKI